MIVYFYILAVSYAGPVFMSLCQASLAVSPDFFGNYIVTPCMMLAIVLVLHVADRQVD